MLLKLKVKKRRATLMALFIKFCSMSLFVLIMWPAILLAQTEYYDVEGENLREVRDNIFGEGGAGPVDGTGTRRAGEARLDFTPNYQFSAQQQDTSCVITITPCATTTSFKCTILLPKWTGYDEASQQEKAEWDRFIQKLTEHEQGHCDRYLTDANKTAVQNAVKAALDGKSITINEPCPEDLNNPGEEFANALDEEVKKLLDNDQNLNNVLEGIEDVQEQYDNETRHGETQGAVLRVR